MSSERRCTCRARDRVRTAAGTGTVYRVLGLADETRLFIMLDSGERISAPCREAERLPTPGPEGSGGAEASACLV